MDGAVEWRGPVADYVPAQLGRIPGRSQLAVPAAAVPAVLGATDDDCQSTSRRIVSKTPLKRSVIAGRGESTRPPTVLTSATGVGGLGLPVHERNALRAIRPCSIAFSRSPSPRAETTVQV